MTARTRRAIAWQAAVLLGLLSGTLSTLIITFGAPRIGRVRSVDWMNIGTVLLRTDGIVAVPGWREIAAGVFVHQSADLSWAIVLFALGRWMSLNMRPSSIAAIAAPWAIVTSVIEYYVILPWLQPLVPSQVPYWTALSVHLTSAAAYPMFPWFRNAVAGRADRTATMWARYTFTALAGVFVLLAGLDTLARFGHEPKWVFQSDDTRAFDRQFMREMVAHHGAGIDLARRMLAAAPRDEVRNVSELIIAEQSGEMVLLGRWWRGWVGAQMPLLTAAEMAQIPGMPSQADLRSLASLRSEPFERKFLAMMIAHHEGAVAMADDAWHRAGDPRLRIFATSVQHAQRGQIDWMRRMLSEHRSFGYKR